MDPAKAIEATATYGVSTVMLILVSFFLAGLVIYILKQNERRENRLAGLIEKDLQQNTMLIQEHDKKSAAAIAMITEANKYIRLEHDAMMGAQKNMQESQEEHTKVLSHLGDRVQLMQERYEQLVKR